MLGVWGAGGPAAAPHLTPPTLRCPQIGMPAVEEVIDAELEYKFACSGYDVRSFVGAALESMSLGGGLEAAKAESIEVRRRPAQRAPSGLPTVLLGNC